MSSSHLTRPDLFYVLVYLRVKDLPPGAKNVGENDAILAAVQDMISLGQTPESPEYRSTYACRLVMYDRVTEWQKEQTAEMLEERGMEVLRRLQVEDPHRKSMEGFDYEKEFGRLLQGFGVFDNAGASNHGPNEQGLPDLNALAIGRRAEDDSDGWSREFRVEAEMDEESADWRPAVTATNLDYARYLLNLLSHYYWHEGLGGGISLGHGVKAVLDLVDIKIDRQLCLLVGMEALQRQLDELIDERESKPDCAWDPGAPAAGPGCHPSGRGVTV